MAKNTPTKYFLKDGSIGLAYPAGQAIMKSGTVMLKIVDENNIPVINPLNKRQQVVFKYIDELKQA